MIHRVQANVDLKALHANFLIAKTLSPQSKMVAVLKANAYGHGLLPVAEALANDTDLFAVTDINEALTLQKATLGKPILILQGIIDPQDIKLIAEAGFQVVISALEQIALLDEMLNTIKLPQALTFWLKLDSGMGRLGIHPEHYLKAYQALISKPYTHEVIMMTHLANSSLPSSELNQRQLSCFHTCEQELTQHSLETNSISTSIAASSGILNTLQTQSDWARPGIMLYGSSPFPFQETALRRENFKLQNVMTLESKIIAIQDLKAGDNVGYCSQFICPQDMRIGIVSIGYADGYPSNAPNGTPVLVNGVRTSTTGRVSMDMIAIDLSPMPDAKIDDTVTLWGQNLSIDEVADHTGILSYNLTCSLQTMSEYSPRVKINHG